MCSKLSLPLTISLEHRKLFSVVLETVVNVVISFKIANNVVK